MPWLLVFDNAEHWTDLRACWPSSTHGSILITSRNADLVETSSSEVALKPFDKQHGANLLLKHIREDPASARQQRDAKLISHALGGLPLAITHVAGYMRQSGISSADFLKVLEERSNSARVLNRNTPIFQYDKTLWIVNDIALQKLDEDSLKLVQILSMMNPDGVPKSLLYGDHDEPALSFLRASDKIRWVA